MNFKKKLIKDYLIHAKRICGKNSLSVLSNMTVWCESEKIHFICTNINEFWFYGDFPTNETGIIIDELSLEKTLYNPISIMEAVNVKKGKIIEVSTEDDELLINGIQIPKCNISYSKFPNDPFDGKTVAAVGSIDRMDVLERAHRFISEDEMRYFMCGVHFKFEDGKVTFEATDGKVALLCSDPMGQYVPSSVNEEKNIIVKDFSKFLKLGMNRFKTWKRNGNENIVFFNDYYTLNVDGIARQFPNVSRVIPADKVQVVRDVNFSGMKEAMDKLTLKLKMLGRLKMSTAFIDIDDKSVWCKVDEDHTVLEEIKTGFSEHLRFNMDYLVNHILDRPGTNCELSVNREFPENHAMMIKDYDLGTVEVFMPCQYN